jgi:hypothetical protein
LGSEWTSSAIGDSDGKHSSSREVTSMTTTCRSLGDATLVDPSEIEICKHSDGSDWLIGQGTYGKVGWIALRCQFLIPSAPFTLPFSECILQLLAFQSVVVALGSLHSLSDGVKQVVLMQNACTHGDVWTGNEVQ